jgi:hypothetical protein
MSEDKTREELEDIIGELEDIIEEQMEEIHDLRKEVERNWEWTQHVRLKEEPEYPTPCLLLEVEDDVCDTDGYFYALKYGLVRGNAWREYTIIPIEKVTVSSNSNTPRGDSYNDRVSKSLSHHICTDVQNLRLPVVFKHKGRWEIIGLEEFLKSRK